MDNKKAAIQSRVAAFSCIEGLITTYLISIIFRVYEILFDVRRYR